MAIAKSTRTSLIPAVGYLRRSTNKQEKSLADQRREIERYAAQHGYRIVRWYTDDAISGDDTLNRAEFQSMRDDCTGNNFAVILCWDQDRFGRFDSLEAGHWIYPIRTAGVRLETVTEGPIDWGDFTGRLMYGIKQEGKHQFLRDLSRNTTRGLINAAMQNVRGGRLLYGYDRMLTDAEGKHHQRVKRGEKFSKPKGWQSALVLSENTEQVDTVLWLFATYADKNIGLRGLASRLNSRGVPSPTGGKWHVGTIAAMLTNPVYCGDFIWPQQRGGKYYHAQGTEVSPRDPAETNGKTKVKLNSDPEQIVKRDVFPAIVDRQLFDRVQRKLARKQTCTSSHIQTNGDRYVLSGLVFCGNCGGRMHGTATSRRKSGKKYVYAKYICSTYQKNGKSQCGCHTVPQDTLAKFLLRKLRDTVMVGEHKDELRRRIRERLEARHKADPQHVGQMQAKIAKLDKEIQHATRRLARAPDDIADLLGNELSEMRRDRDRLAAQLSELERVEPADIDAEVEAAVDRLWSLSDELDQAEPAKLRELFDRMVKRIDLWYEQQPQGKRFVHELVRGSIELYPDPVMFGLVAKTVV